MRSYNKFLQIKRKIGDENNNTIK